MIRKGPTAWCCEQCRPHLTAFARRLLNQIARLVEETYEGAAGDTIAKTIRKAASTYQFREEE